MPTEAPLKIWAHLVKVWRCSLAFKFVWDFQLFSKGNPNFLHFSPAKIGNATKSPQILGLYNLKYGEQLCRTLLVDPITSGLTINKLSTGDFTNTRRGPMQGNLFKIILRWSLWSTIGKLTVCLFLFPEIFPRVKH